MDLALLHIGLQGRLRVAMLALRNRCELLLDTFLGVELLLHLLNSDLLVDFALVMHLGALQLLLCSLLDLPDLVPAFARAPVLILLEGLLGNTFLAFQGRLVDRFGTVFFRLISPLLGLDDKLVGFFVDLLGLLHDNLLGLLLIVFLLGAM